MTEFFSENPSPEVKALRSFVLGVCGGFAVGFIAGAAVTAIFDYLDEKRKALEKLRKDSDENYLYSAE